MFFIWQGWGWLTLIAFTVGGISGAFIDRSTGGLLGDGGAVGLGCLVAAIVTALWSLLALRPLARRRNPDVTFWQAQRANTMFFVPMLFWSPVLLVLAPISWIFIG